MCVPRFLIAVSPLVCLLQSSKAASVRNIPGYQRHTLAVSAGQRCDNNSTMIREVVKLTNINKYLPPVSSCDWSFLFSPLFPRSLLRGDTPFLFFPPSNIEL